LRAEGEYTPLRTYLNIIKKIYLTLFLKIFAKKFAGMKKLYYLCRAFEEITLKTDKIMIKVFYCFPDFVDKFNDNMSYDECFDFVRANMGEIYSLEQFEIAFNNEEISDLGYIKFFHILNK
jgi:hypothetical protein